MKQIRIFSSKSMFTLTEQVNEFIKTNNIEDVDIQYSTTSTGWLLFFSQEHSVMISWEER